MKKKFFSFVMALIMVVSVMSLNVFAEEEIKKVEIEFCVGDDTLMINGKAVKVEKPYVVGAGVTLVPVRVITEAFGAKVDWINETRTVTLEYPDVNIVLQIGNPIAEVNGKAETLLAAPELPTDTTMVPLRFISETFGAEVSYDPETERITVIKDLNKNGNSTVEGAIDSKYVGDSFYGWSMENPSDAAMDYRYFDGTYTSFAYDDNNWFDISIEKKKADFDFKKEFESMKSSFAGYTLMKAESDTSNPDEMKMHFQAKVKEQFIDFYVFVKNEYIFIVYGEFLNENADVKADGLKVLESFTLDFKAEDTYDLSNAKNGMRRFESENLKLSFDVPDSYLMTSDEEAENHFAFESIDEEDASSINAVVYSKESVENAKIVANKDYERNKKHVNESVSKFQPVVEKTYGEISGYEYTYDLFTMDEKSMNRDFFFEVGEYVYNIHVSVDSANKNKTDVANKILESIKAEEIDFNEVGVILRNESSDDDTTSVCDKISRCEFTVPDSFEEMSASYTSTAHVNYQTGVVFNVSCDASKEYTYSGIKEEVKSVELGYKKMMGATIIESTKDVVMGKNKFAFLEMKCVQDKTVVYIQQYAAVHDGIGYVINVLYPEIGYSEYARSMVKNIVSSITFK